MKKALSLIAVSLVLSLSGISQENTLKWNGLKNERAFNQGFSVIAGSILTGAIYKNRGLSPLPALATGAGGLSMIIISSERQKRISDHYAGAEFDMWYGPQERKQMRNGSGWAIAGLFYAMSMFAVSQNPDNGGGAIGVGLTVGLSGSLIYRSLRK